MTLFAPYDGSPLSTAALERASELTAQTDQPLVVATVVPRDRRTAVDDGWLAVDILLRVNAEESRPQLGVSGLQSTQAVPR